MRKGKKQTIIIPRVSPTVVDQSLPKAKPSTRQYPQPMSPELLTAARLREIANDLEIKAQELRVQAASLEAVVGVETPNRRKHVEFIDPRKEY